MTKKDNNFELGWVLIPPHIMARKDLTLTDKVLLGKINGLTGEKGYCWASNEWLGKQIGIEEQTVKNLLVKFAKMKLINREFIYTEKMEIQERRLTLTPFTADGNTPYREKYPPRTVKSTPYIYDNRVISTIETITKVIAEKPVFGDPDINFLCDLFKKEFGNLPRLPEQRKMSKILINKFGKEMVFKAAEYAVSLSAEQYAPKITNPSQLWNKWADLVSYGKKSGQVVPRSINVTEMIKQMEVQNVT